MSRRGGADGGQIQELRGKNDMPSSADENSDKTDRSLLQGVRVLVVEDTWHVAKALKAVLEQLGMRVSGPAATTDQAKRLMSDEKPDIAVVDINLRREMAFGLIEEMHEQGVRVLVSSGCAMPLLPEGKVAAMLQKPYSAAQLLSALQGMMSDARKP
jgi:DNA-binding response OmpR family regulator